MQELIQVVIFLYSVILHEIAHGVMAQSMGDETAVRAGRITLNPIKHIDLFGSILLPMVMYFASNGSFVFGYAKPVPYNPLNLRDQKYGPAKVALAGPLANVLLAILAGLVFRIFSGTFDNQVLENSLQYAVGINLMLAVFNLVPIQPLDGHWLLLTFLPRRFAEVKYFLVRYGMLIFIVFIFFGFQYLMPLINFLYSVIVGK